MKKSWRQLRASEPGRRFQDSYRRKRSDGETAAGRALSMGAGLALVAVGVILLFVPGPGIVLILAGSGLLARESKRVAVALDRAEPRVRAATRRARRAWRGAPVPVRAALALLAVLASLWMAWLLYRRWLA